MPSTTPALHLEMVEQAVQLPAVHTAARRHEELLGSIVAGELLSPCTETLVTRTSTATESLNSGWYAWMTRPYFSPTPAKVLR
jgi:hypothetical protein